jgi:NADH:ubiquinone oxidoreductase subunit 5 (subunit L)/multisubunit Na+/H+ antiporter MnhA subunit
MNTTILAALVPGLPLLGAIVIASLRRSLKGNSAGYLGTLAIGSAFALSVMLFLGHDPAAGPYTAHLFNWIDIGGMHSRSPSRWTR